MTPEQEQLVRAYKHVFGWDGQRCASAQGKLVFEHLRDLTSYDSMAIPKGHHIDTNALIFAEAQREFFLKIKYMIEFDLSVERPDTALTKERNDSNGTSN
jgi:hypothetical protein